MLLPLKKWPESESATNFPLNWLLREIKRNPWQISKTISVIFREKNWFTKNPIYNRVGDGSFSKIPYIASYLRQNIGQKKALYSRSYT